MLRNRPANLGFVEPKIDPLFEMEVELDPHTDNLDQRCELMTINFDGSVYNDQKMYVGKIPAARWNYIRQFDKPTKMERTAYNRFNVKVCGEIDKTNIFQDPHDRPYIYRCGETLFMPYMIPGEEYFCDLTNQQDHFDILVDQKKIGELKDEKDRNRLKNLRAMLGKGYQATAQIELTPRRCLLLLVVRKV